MSDLAALRAQAKALRAEGRREAAAEAWAALLAASPDDPEALFRVGEDKLYGGWAEDADSLFLASFQRRRDPAAIGMALLARLYRSVPAERRRDVIETWARAHAPADPVPVHRIADRNPQRPLRLGYLSADLRAHPVGLTLWVLFHCHDRHRFEVHAFATKRHGDDIAAQLERAADVWHDVSGLRDDAIAAAIAAAGIDILVAPAAQFDDNRVGVLRRRPAPVQVVSNSAATTGMPEADYFLGDFVGTPRNGPEWFSERVLRLPCYTVAPLPAELPPVAPLPALQDGRVTFGCFGSPAKIGAECVALWSRVLKAVPQSDMLLKYRDVYGWAAVRERVLALFSASGIDPQRVRFVREGQVRTNHLAAYAEVDIALDTVPFNGVTTTFEALAMGAPVIALNGETMAARSAASVLIGAGLAPLVADDAEGYAMRAAELASNLPRLSALRGTLRRRVEKAAYCDARGHTRWTERYFRAIWRRYCLT
ncbi:MAG: hypothetical protein AB7G39_02650 [Alphaproteobacteria bacterium]